MQSFSLHIGGVLRLPTPHAAYRLPDASASADSAAAAAAAADPFDTLPFRGLAERLGGAVAPALAAARDGSRRGAAAARAAAAAAPAPALPPLPAFLPFSAWAARSPAFQATLVADAGGPKRARLSWYHPDDTMVPRGWLKDGLLADMAHYNPFNLGGVFGGGARAAAPAAEVQQARALEVR